MVTGYPTSGKSTRAKQLYDDFSERLKTPAGSKYRLHLISDETLSISRSVYDLSPDKVPEHTRSANASEKDARAAIYAAVRRVLSPRDIVILDHLNYIKGWRYQLFCEAKNISTPSCVLQIGCSVDKARAVNEERLARRDGSRSNETAAEDATVVEPYEQANWDNLVFRYEEPNPMSRWDSPLFALVWDDDESRAKEVFQDIWDGIAGEGREKVVPNKVVIQRGKDAGGDYLYTLDRETQAIVKRILELQPDEGGGEIKIPKASGDGDLILELPGRKLLLPQLQRLRRAFLGMNRGGIGLEGLGNMSVARVQESFVGRLHFGTMALLTQTFTAASNNSIDLRLTELDRLLSRLQQSALRASAERQRLLLSNAFAREKLSTSIEHARAQLSGLERDALGVKIHAHRQGLQVNLTRKREIVEELVERMRDLEEMAGSMSSGDKDDEDDEDDGGDDVLSAIGVSTSSGTDEVIPTPSESMDSTSADSGIHGIEPTAATIPSPAQRHDEGSKEAAQAVAAPAHKAPETTTTQSIRSRGAKQSSSVEGQGAKPPAATTAAATTTGHNLFGNREREAGDLTTATTEAILDQQRAEQEQLSESMVKMARSLKESSRAFAASLEEDQAVMQRASEGLNKNELGIEAATRRMGTLRKMTEGEGWWGRMRLYAMVYGLMVALILFVFVIPKLRF
ncbi:hypothetical protein PpBr36_03572 [Pyricularia pennisetigena]|uniref:hypothetical protein n=1 Tax=Pyricularia pennisetigena TaxID=1578925 RepID=UPI00114EB4E8|nr:hypothetical protein PpBr36_03572 [Pyricularia pennisetigena]TLS30715.1 hypothetical protein PpBr36_03572 [Pyricularia pennisetigena]